MSILYMNGFDHYDTATGAGHRLFELDPANWGKGSDGSFDAYIQDMPTMPVLGGKGLKIPYTDASTGGSSLTKTQASFKLAATQTSGTTLGVGFHFYGSVPAQTRGLLGFGSSVDTQTMVMNILSNGGLEFRLGTSSGTLVASAGAGTILNNVLYHFELKIFTHASAGTVECRVGGTPVFTATGLNTLSSPVVQYLNFSQGGTNLSGAQALAFYQIKDFFVWDSTTNFLGEKNVYTIFPNADTAQTDWTKSTGVDGYDLINDVPAVDATRYIESTVVGDTSTFELTTPSSLAISVSAIQTVVRAQKTLAGAGSIQFGPKSGGVAALSASTGLTQSQFLIFNSVSEINPDTLTSWSSSDLTALQATVVRSL